MEKKKLFHWKLQLVEFVDSMCYVHAGKHSESSCNNNKSSRSRKSTESGEQSDKFENLLFFCWFQAFQV